WLTAGIGGEALALGMRTQDDPARLRRLLRACGAFRCSPHGGAEGGVHSHELEPGPLPLAQLLRRELTLFVDVALARTSAGPVVLPHVRTPAPIRLPALAPQWSDFLGQLRRAHCAPPPHEQPIPGLSRDTAALALTFGIPSIRVARNGHEGLVSHRLLFTRYQFAATRMCQAAAAPVASTNAAGPRRCAPR